MNVCFLNKLLSLIIYANILLFCWITKENSEKFNFFVVFVQVGREKQDDTIQTNRRRRGMILYLYRMIWNHATPAAIVVNKAYTLPYIMPRLRTLLLGLSAILPSPLGGAGGGLYHDIDNPSRHHDDFLHLLAFGVFGGAFVGQRRLPGVLAADVGRQLDGEACLAAELYGHGNL